MASNDKASTRIGNSKARRFQLTLNQVEKYEQLKEYLIQHNTFKYLLSCKEKAPTTGHEHIHIFVCFKNSIKLSIKKSCGAHIECCRGTVKQNVDYIKKDGNILDEIGELPRERGGCHTVGELKQMEDPDELNHFELRTWERIHEKMRREQEFDKMLNEIRNNNLFGPEVIYFTGEAGMGKTYSAYEYAQKKYEDNDIGKITFNNGFADIIRPEAPCIICEEFRPSDLRASKLLEFLDKYGAAINVKGGFEYLRPKTIIFASIFRPQSLYEDQEKNTQFMRRIKHIYELRKEATYIWK